MKRLLLSLALLYSLSLSAGIPYLIQPTNAPGLVGQQLFSVGNGYSWWDWSTNAASSNSTVVSASTSVGVTTNGFNFTPFLSAGVTNWVNAQDTVVSNGVYGLFNGGTNITFGYARSLGAADTNNDTVVSNGVFNLLNTGTNDSFAYSRSVGVLATNQDLKTSNTLWLMITNVYVDVGGNGGTTNRSGQNVTFTVVPGSGGSATNAIDNNNGNGTNTTLWTKVIFTNATLQSSLVWDGTTLTQQGGTNLSSMSNLLVTGWATINGVQTNLSTLYAPNFVTPTNTPTDGYVVTATGTAGATKWAAGGAGAQTNDAILIAGDTSVTIVTNTATAGKTKYTITSAGGTPTNSIYGGVFGTNVNTGQLVIDANGNFAQYGTNASMFQLKDTSSNVWLSATSSNTTLTVNGTMNLASAGFTNANFLNPPYMSGANITNVYASNIVSGGQLPLGTVSTGVTAVAGPFLTTNGASRSYSFNAGGLTNIQSGAIVMPFTNAVTSTAPTTNSPAGNELATAGWVRSLFNNGILDYTTTNIDGVATNTGTGQPVYQFWQGTIPQSAVRTYTTGDFLTNNGYVGSVMTTNTFQTLQGPVQVNQFIGLTGGGAAALSLHTELYYGYDKTNWYGDYETGPQSIIVGQTNLYQWVVTFPVITSTNANGFYIMRRTKVHSVSSTPTMYVLVGTNSVSGVNNAAHIAFDGPSSALGNAFLANTQTFTGSNTFSGGLWASSYKNLPARSIGITIDGGGSAITSGVKGFLEVPYACTVLSATILGDQSGTIAVETWRTNSASMPPTRAGALFTNYLAAAQASTDATLTGATSLALATQDRIGFNVTTNANAVTRITLQLRVQP